MLQEKVVRFDQGSRFVPIATSGSSRYHTRGFIVLRDTEPGEEIAYVETQFKPAEPAAAPEADDDEPAPPEDFEFNPEDEERGF